MRLVAAVLFVVVAVLAAGASQAQLSLLMFQSDGCSYCRKWDREIAAIYPKTPEGRAAPLTRLDIHDELPDGVTVQRKPQLTPTFVLVENGSEIGRIEGYPGEAFFWGLLDRIMPEAAR